MKKSLLLLLVFIFSSLAQQKEYNIYLSNSGNDNLDGSLPVINKEKNKGPFKTLNRLKEEIIKICNNENNISFNIIFKGGIYNIEKTFKIDSNLTKNKNVKIVFKNYKNDTVRFSGGIIVSNFTKIDDQSILKRLNPKLINKIIVANLKPYNINEYGTPPYRFDVLYKGQFMPVSRYPNTGWVNIYDVPQTGDSLYNKGDHKVIKNGKFAGKHYGKFSYSDNRPSNWLNKKDIWMHGYWVWDWKDDFQLIDKIDTIKKEIYPAKPFHHYGYEKGQRYYYFNILEELDQPGEWYFDKENELLYFYPPNEIAFGDVMLSILNQPMFLIENSSNIKFEKIIFECSKTRVIDIVSGNNNIIAGCTIRSIGADTAIVIRGGSNNGVLSCDIYDVGATGIAINGGDKITLTPGNNFAINNHITRFANKIRAFSAAIYIRGVGNIASHNKIHNAPFSGLQYYGNDHLLEYNEIFDIAHEAGDVGGMNTGADYTDMGTKIRFNYFHNIHGPGEGNCRAVYLDLPGSNTTIFGNIFFDVDMGVFFNSGRDNKVENNIFIKCNPSVNNYNWPHKNYFYEGGAWKIWEKMMQFKYNEPPYSVKYPVIKSYYDSGSVGLPINNIYRFNVSYGGSFMDLSEDIPLNRIVIENNLICDSVILNLVKKWTIDIDPYAIPYTKTYTQNDKDMVRYFENNGNKILKGNPGFVNYDKNDFRLKKSSIAYKLGFKPIPVNRIGLYKDRYRIFLPDNN